MPVFDRRCNACGTERIDVYEAVKQADPVCDCGGTLEKMWAAPPAVIQDSIEGGLWIRHGLCHPDGSPKRYDSKSDIRRAEKASGWANHVEHKPESRGSDKSKHTSRWV